MRFLQKQQNQYLTIVFKTVSTFDLRTYTTLMVRLIFLCHNTIKKKILTKSIKRRI